MTLGEMHEHLEWIVLGMRNGWFTLREATDHLQMVVIEFGRDLEPNGAE